MPDEPGQADLSGTMYTSMGTSLHAAIQLFMTLAGPGAGAWGRWECRSCGEKTQPILRPPDCCGQPMAYHEVDLRVGPLTGHPDLIVRYDRPGWVLYEFKTTGRKPREPYGSHLLQARHYIAMLRIQHKISVSAYVIVYIGRQSLERWVFGPYDASGSARETRDLLSRAIAGFKAATVARRDPSRRNLAAVVRERPCVDTQSWGRYMAKHFDFRDKKCPMLPHCTAGDRACLRAVEATIRGEAL